MPVTKSTSKSPKFAHEGSLAPEFAARVRKLQLRTHRLVNTALTGGYRSVFRGQGIEFEEVRPYVPGDDVRGIDWNVTARTGKPHIKSYREERELSVHCLVDQGLGMGFGTRRWSKREAAAQLVGLFAKVAARNQDRVGLTLYGPEPGLHLDPRKSTRHIQRLIREVMVAQPFDVPGDLKRVLEGSLRALRRRSLVLIFSDFADAGGRGWVQAMRALAARHDVIGVRLVDPFEVRLPKVGRFAIEDLNGGDWNWIDAADKGVREGWQQAAEQRKAEIHGALRESRASRIDISLDEDLAAPILRFFRLRMARAGRAK